MTEDRNEREESEICIHIFSVSAGMVGVCLTVIGIFRAVGELKAFDSLGDNILAVDALIFLVSCLTSYLALRSKNKIRKRKIRENRRRGIFNRLIADGGRLSDYRLHACLNF